MTITRAASFFAALAMAFLGSFAASAQDVVVLEDSWTARWTDGRKSSWSHLRIEHHGDHGRSTHDPGAPPGDVSFVVSETTIAVVDSTARMTISSWTTTDSEGRIVVRRLVEEAPWGRSDLEVGAVTSGARWRRCIREFAPQEGELAETPWDVDVVALRLRGTGTAPVSTELPILSLMPTVSVRAARLEVQHEPGGTTTLRVDGRTTASWSADGHAVPRRIREGVWSGPTSSERAADLTEPSPAPQDPAPQDSPSVANARTGVRIRVPGPEWIVTDTTLKEGQLASVNVVHPNWTWGSALIEDGRIMGATEAERLRFATAVRTKFGQYGLADPVPCIFQDRAGFSFPVRLPVAGIELTGELVLVDLGTARATVWAVQASDLRVRRPEDLRRALHSFELVDVQRTWQRVALGKLSAEVPAHWTPVGLGEYQASTVGSRVMLCRERRGDRSLEEVARVPLTDEPEVEIVEESRATGEVAGRTALTLVHRAAATMPDGNVVTIRYGTCVADVGDGLCEAVVIKAHEVELDRDEVAYVLRSVQWGR